MTFSHTQSSAKQKQNVFDLLMFDIGFESRFKSAEQRVLNSKVNKNNFKFKPFISTSTVIEMNSNRVVARFEQKRQVFVAELNFEKTTQFRDNLVYK